MRLSAAWREGDLETEGRRRNPVGVDVLTERFSQGGSFLATLGFEMQSRWDWKKGGRSKGQRRTGKGDGIAGAAI